MFAGAYAFRYKYKLLYSMGTVKAIFHLFCFMTGHVDFLHVCHLAFILFKLAFFRRLSWSCKT